MIPLLECSEISKGKKERRNLRSIWERSIQEASCARTKLLALFSLKNCSMHVATAWPDRCKHLFITKTTEM
jgi:SET domain-containing protein